MPVSLEILLGLIVVGAALYRLARRRLAVGAWLLAGVLFATAACGWLPAKLLAGLQTPYAQRPVPGWSGRDAIVLLGAGTVRIPGDGVEPTVFAQGRINEAVRLYRACKAHGGECRLEVSGGDALHTGRSEAQVYAETLVALGVAPGDLLLEVRSMNTWQNAQFGAPLLRAQGVRRVWLVSSAFHLRRASRYFAHFGVHAVPVRGDWLKARVGWMPQAWNLTVTDAALHEYIGVWRFHVYNRFGWNAATTQPGAP